MSNNILTRSERDVLRVIFKRSMIRSDELHEQLSRLSSRTISAAVSSLREKGLVRRIPDLTDMRRGLYVLSESFASRLRARVEAPIVV